MTSKPSVIVREELPTIRAATWFQLAREQDTSER